MDAQNERVKLVRTALGLNQTDFGDRLGVTVTAISKIELGKNAVTDQMFKAICREFNVDPVWMREGIGDMFIDDEGEIDNLIDVLMDGENEVAKATFKALAKMGGDTWEQFGKIIRAIAKELDGPEG